MIKFHIPWIPLIKIILIWPLEDMRFHAFAQSDKTRNKCHLEIMADICDINHLPLVTKVVHSKYAIRDITIASSDGSIFPKRLFNNCFQGLVSRRMISYQMVSELTFDLSRTILFTISGQLTNIYTVKYLKVLVYF